jgi:inorganic triphosphatase YgiF
LTIDKGTIAAGRRSSPVREVELELKRGDAAELFKVARTLARQVPAQLTVTSKPERGYALIAGEKASAVGAAPVAISPDASCQTAFQISAWACLHQIVANQDPTRNGDPEGVHQARVGLRRLRAAISRGTESRSDAYHSSTRHPMGTSMTLRIRLAVGLRSRPTDRSRKI